MNQNLIEAYEAMIEAEAAVGQTHWRGGHDYDVAFEAYLSAKQLAVEAGWDQRTDPRPETQVVAPRRYRSF